jgi:hypothetical protein
MTSGGTEATFTALLAARSRAIPDVWTNGMPSNGPVVVCGEHTHYAVTRAAGELGLGLQRVVVIPSRDYKMDVGGLRAALAHLRDQEKVGDGRRATPDAPRPAVSTTSRQSPTRARSSPMHAATCGCTWMPHMAARR